MAKYHISDDGTPRPCKAEPGNCPVSPDNEHYTTLVQARAAYEARQDPAFIADGFRRRPREGTYQQPRDRFESEVVEPPRDYDYVVVSTLAGKLTRGDLIVVDGDDLVITDVKIGYKNATFRVRDNMGRLKTLVRKADETVAAKERQETKLSATLRRTYLAESSLEHDIRNYRPRRAAAAARITEAIQKGYTVSSSDILSLTSAEADDTVATQYEAAVIQTKKAIAEGDSEYAGETNPYTRAYNELKEEYSRQILRYAERGESNSTSALSNVYEVEMNRARARFVERGLFF